MSSFLDWFNFCVHEWETTNKYKSNLYSDYDRSLPVRIYQIIEQRCTKCGEEVVRKFKV